MLIRFLLAFLICFPAFAQRVKDAPRAGYAQYHTLPSEHFPWEKPEAEQKLAMGAFFKGVTGTYTAPTVVQSVTTTASGVLVPGNTATILVTFSAPITVSGSPVLNLTATPSSNASFTSYSGAVITFTYIVTAGQTTAGSNLGTAITNAITGGAVINAVSGQPAVLTGANNQVFAGLSVNGGSATTCSRNFYVAGDGTGNDAWTGQSLTHTGGSNGPWATFTPVIAGPSGKFQGGDCVYFQGGQTFTGMPWFDTASNMATTISTSAPFIISGGNAIGWGSGNPTFNANSGTNPASPAPPYPAALMSIAANGGAISGVTLQNINFNANGQSLKFCLEGWAGSSGISYVTIQNNDASGCAQNTVSNETGAELAWVAVSYATASHIYFIGNNAHGATISATDFTGIACGATDTGATSSIVDCEVVGNHVYYIGGSSTAGGSADGIGFISCSGCLAKYNLANDNGYNTKSCGGPSNFISNDSSVTWQYNESARQRPSTYPSSPGGCDWDDYDLDGGTTNSLVEYNYGHDSFGACLLAYVGGKYGGYNATWTNNIYRYNICENSTEGFSTTAVPDYATNPSDTWSLYVYNNTLYTPYISPNAFGASAPMAFGANPMPNSGVIENNILATTNNGGNAQYIICFTNSLTGSGLTMKGNAYVNLSGSGSFYVNNCPGSYSSFSSWVSAQPNGSGDTASTQASPSWAGTPPQGNCETTASTTSGPQPCPAQYQLTAASTAYLGTGYAVSSPGSLDYYLNTIPNGIGTGYNIGAYGGVPQFVLSPTGSDTAACTTTAPCATLAHAQALMRASSTAKTTCLQSGTYTLSSQISLTSSDNGETWTNCSGATPVIDGGNTTTQAFNYNTVTGGTINGITIQHFTQNGISYIASSGLVFTDNTIRNLTSGTTGMGCILGYYQIGSVTIKNNLCENNTGPGIVFQMGPGDAGYLAGPDVENNIILNVNTGSITDTGAIYFWNYGPVITTMPASIVKGNIIGNFGSLSGGGKCIYLDDNVNHVDVEQNVCFGTGQYPWQIHGGGNNTIRNNVFDISQMKNAGFYQDSAAQTNNAAGNVVDNNIVVSYSQTSPSQMFDFIWQYTGTTFNKPTVTNNNYFLAGGTFANYTSQTSNSTSFSDSNPVVGNPIFGAGPVSSTVFQPGLSYQPTASVALSSPVSFPTLASGQGPGGTITATAFKTAAGIITTSFGSTFLPRGLNLQDLTFSTLLSGGGTTPLTNFFPDTNMVIVWVPDSLATPSAFDSIVNPLTAAGIYVVIADYTVPVNTGGCLSTSPGNRPIYTGSALTTNESQFAALATHYASNPFVGFETLDEPCDVTASGQTSTAQAGIYNAIRATAGSNALVFFQPIGGDFTNGMTASAYTSMTNVAWDVHYYAWLSSQSTSQTTNATTAQIAITGGTFPGAGFAGSQPGVNSFTTSSAGIMPVIIGEFGNSTTGGLNTLDAACSGSIGCAPVVNAIFGLGYGWTAFTAWNQNYYSAYSDAFFTNYPTNCSYPSTGCVTTLNAYGAAVAAGIDP